MNNFNKDTWLIEQQRKYTLKRILSLRFYTSDKCLKLQLLKQKNLPSGKNKGYIRTDPFKEFQILTSPKNKILGLIINVPFFEFQQKKGNIIIYFKSNKERDIFLNHIVSSITCELFSDKIIEGCECFVKNKTDPLWDWNRRIFLHKKGNKYITIHNNKEEKWDYAISISTKPWIFNNYGAQEYTWIK